PANLLMSHFPVKSGGTATFTPQQRLTGGQPDVGTDGVLHRNPIRDWRSGPSRRKDCLKVAFKAPSLPYQSTAWINIATGISWDRPDEALETSGETRRKPRQSI
ncbi:MAG TPA: hypothetical protein VNC42_10795, partial [Bradyrhizobium sp.]|nr:hypothetical protein [Bradyrhizobium sp.]